MNPEQLWNTIYLGDRACKAILIDGWEQRVSFQVNLISRLRPGTTTWNFYTDADIENGWLVFTDVQSICFDPSGPIPNDFINDVEVKPIPLGGKAAWRFELSISSVGERGISTEVIIRIEANGFHLEDPAKPGVKITE